jgi:eukaryotic-like serine/threonine-protein kinase
MGTKLEYFEIGDLLGAGGMGEVYRARDTKLNRDVAIKVLPEAFASDPDRLARFHREAQVLASLSHPNIGVIHGIHESRGVRFLVLELLKGETLASRLKQGPAPIDEALELLKQIAGALEAAHEKGILHRDLKPANIQITSDGVVKVLDFGLAKMLQPEGPPVDTSNSPTLMSQTIGGVILGTAAYMSPEQARGRTVDKRTDTWAFGCVAYEMLTGRQAFGGETLTDIIASVMKGEPDWSRLPAATPSTLRSLLRQCLNKQANHRLHEIADARIAVEEALTEPDLPIPLPTAKARDWRWTVLGFATFLLIGAIIGWLATRKPPEIREPMRFQMSVGRGEKLVGSITSVRPSRTAIAIHPNGKMLVFNGDAKDSPPQLYARELAQSEAIPIPGTQRGIGPFFSPDGQWIGFFSNGQIKKVPVGGGPPVVICDVSKGTQGLFGASWAEDGTIYFSDEGSGISKVPSGGGTPAPVTTSDSAKGEEQVLPHVLPGGKAVIFTSVTASEWDRARIIVQSLQGQERRDLVQGAADARYVSTGHLVYMKMGTLMAVPFDVQQLRVTGEPLSLVEGVMQAVNQPNSADETGSGQFAVSNTGTLVYVTGGLHPNRDSVLVWVDKKGEVQPIPGAGVHPFASPRLSPDQSKIAIAVMSASRNTDLWVYDILRGGSTRLTFGGFNWPVVWSPDGKRVVFSSNASGVGNLYLASADGSGQPERLATSGFSQWPSSWSSQSNSIAYLQSHPTNWQIWVLPMDGERKPKLFLESRFDLRYPEFSPDGHWIAYTSSESGRGEVYVQPYPGAGEKYRISTAGGTQPIWSANGRELLFRSGLSNGDGFFAATISSLNPFRTEPPRLLFQTKPGEYSHTTPVRSWDATRDLKRFLLTRNEESKDQPVTHLEIVLNWDEELKRRVPTK